MVLQKLWVSQNFSRISRVSQCRFLSGYVRLAVSFFIRRWLGVSKHFEVSVSQSKKSKCLGLAKKYASLAVSHLPFANPYISLRRLRYTVGGWILPCPRAVETDAESAVVSIYLGEFDNNERLVSLI